MHKFWKSNSCTSRKILEKLPEKKLKSLDFLMEFLCFIECTPGCHQTGLRLCSSEIQFKSNRLCAPGRLRTLFSRPLNLATSQPHNLWTSQSVCVCVCVCACACACACVFCVIVVILINYWSGSFHADYNHFSLNFNRFLFWVAYLCNNWTPKIK